MSIAKNIEIVLLEGLEQLIKDGSSKRYWSSNRSTSDALMALQTCLPMDEYSHLRSGALEHLLSQSEITADGKRHWMDEVWDTSVAMLALATEPLRFAMEVNQAREWLSSKYLTAYNSWNDELWETLWAINALSYLDRVIPIPKHKTNTDFSGAIEWLLKMVDTPEKGILVNWSSTALFVLFASKPSLPGLTEAKTEKVIAQSKISMQKFLETPGVQSGDLLWTPEAWSNALVLWSISVNYGGLLNEEDTFKMTKWFKDRVSLKDLPTEDRAFSCIALFKYLLYYSIENAKAGLGNNIHSEIQLVEEIKEKLKIRLANKLKKRVVDFKPRPPIISSTAHADYYSINMGKKFTNVFLIISVTITLSYASWKAGTLSNSDTQWIPVIPIVLGTLASVAQLANFNLISKRKRTSEE